MKLLLLLLALNATFAFAQDTHPSNKDEHLIPGSTKKDDYFTQKKDAQINNVEASQQGQNIVVTYDLETEQPCTINLFISTNGGNTWQGPLKQVQGHVGPNIKSEKKSITLFVLNEFNELRGDNIRFKVDALTNNLNTIKIGNQSLIEKYLDLQGKPLSDFEKLYFKIGPLNAINSALIPGWGKRRVTNKEKKGWGIFFFVTTPLTISLVSKFISDKNYKNYYAARDQASIDDYFMKANRYNSAAINFRNIGVTFYLYDIVWVFIKGYKNIVKAADKLDNNHIDRDALWYKTES